MYGRGPLAGPDGPDRFNDCRLPVMAPLCAVENRVGDKKIRVRGHVPLTGGRVGFGEEFEDVEAV